MTEHTTHLIKLTSAQTAILPALMTATGLNKSELIRYALSLAADEKGMAFPNDMAKRGEWKRMEKHA